MRARVRLLNKGERAATGGGNITGCNATITLDRQLETCHTCITVEGRRRSRWKAVSGNATLVQTTNEMQ